MLAADTVFAERVPVRVIFDKLMDGASATVYTEPDGVTTMLGFPAVTEVTTACQDVPPTPSVCKNCPADPRVKGSTMEFAELAFNVTVEVKFEIADVRVVKDPDEDVMELNDGLRTVDTW